MYVVLSESEIIVVYPSLVTGLMILHPIFSPTEAGTSAVWDFQLEIRILRSDPNKGKVFEFLEESHCWQLLPVYPWIEWTNDARSCLDLGVLTSNCLGQPLTFPRDTFVISVEKSSSF